MLDIAKAWAVLSGGVWFEQGHGFNGGDVEREGAEEEFEGDSEGAGAASVGGVSVGFGAEGTAEPSGVLGGGIERNSALEENKKNEARIIVAVSKITSANAVLFTESTK